MGIKELLKDTRFRLKLFIHTYKKVNLKPIYKCNFNELIDRDSNSMLLCRTYTVTALCVFGYMMGSALDGDINLLVVFSFLLFIIMGYDENRKRENIQLYIYMHNKKKYDDENIISFNEDERGHGLWIVKR